MAIVVGQTTWQIALNIAATPEGCPAFGGGTIICKNGGVAWIVAPASTQVCQSFPAGSGNKCCVCDWTTLNTAIINAGLTPGSWFVPSVSQLQCPGYCCRSKWDHTPGVKYWSSTEIDAGVACRVDFGTGGAEVSGRSDPFLVRAFRCVTY